MPKEDTQFKKGNPGGPGRPKGSGISITTAIKRKLEERPHGVDKRTYLEMLVDKIIEKAATDGDGTTIKQIWNYVDGMPKQDIGVEVTDKRIILD